MNGIKGFCQAALALIIGAISLFEAYTWYGLRGFLFASSVTALVALAMIDWRKFMERFGIWL